ncbi:hypothetical protein BASA84_001156 [Batrachochytrium salamandrivorans]|nr:hypothetical protein BASA84_001156 [Batrachochytrium salamandrivorans]
MIRLLLSWHFWMKQVRHHSSRFLTQRSRRSVVVPAGSTKRKAIQRDKSLFEHATGRKCSRCVTVMLPQVQRTLQSKNVEFDGLISTRKPNSPPPKRFICEETGKPLATEHMPKPFRTLIEQLHKGKMEAAHATFSEIEKTDPEMLTVLTIAGFNRIIEAVSDKTLHILRNYSSKQRVARTREILSRMESSGRKTKQCYL